MRNWTAPLALLCILLPAAAGATSLAVPGLSNIYGSGHAVAPGDGGGGGGSLPPGSALPGGTGRVMTIAGTSGTVVYGACCAPNGPDGIEATVGEPYPVHGGIAGCDLPTRARYLAAVFLDDQVPSDPAPPRLEIADIDFASLSPGLGQVFFVGDGQDGNANPQLFHVPDGATRVFFGFIDRCAHQKQLPGCYDDNGGGIGVEFSIEGATAASVPSGLTLRGPQPSPANPTSVVRYRVGPLAGRLSLFDLRGRLVRSVGLAPGEGWQSLPWTELAGRGPQLPAGLYFLRLDAGGSHDVVRAWVAR